MSRTAHRVAKEQLHSSGGLETKVDIAAGVLVLLQGVAAVFLVGALHEEGLIPAAGILFASFFQWLLLRCLAEHLRLQKKQAGVAYEGRISGPTMITIYCCSSCQSMLHSDSRCDMCGAEIQGDQPRATDGGSEGQ